MYGQAVQLASNGMYGQAHVATEIGMQTEDAHTFGQACANLSNKFVNTGFVRIAANAKNLQRWKLVFEEGCRLQRAGTTRVNTVMLAHVPG